MSILSDGGDRQSKNLIETLSRLFVLAIDRSSASAGATNEAAAHATLWSAIVIAQRDLGGPGVCEWLRDQADSLEAGIMRDHGSDLLN